MKNIRLLASIAAGSVLLSSTALAQEADKKAERAWKSKCASCHGPSGDGMTRPDGGYLFPALWGPKSFNVGAGMARLNNAAGFVKQNMPLGQATLSDQEAFDVAAFFTAQARPDFAGKSGDWPKGDRPVDARY